MSIRNASGSDTPVGSAVRPSLHDHDITTAIVTAGVFVALADGWVDPVERDALVRDLSHGRLSAGLSPPEVRELFEQRVRCLRGAECADLVLDALRPLAHLSLAADVVRIGERIAAADGYVHRQEILALTLIRLVMTSLPQPKRIA